MHAFKARALLLSGEIEEAGDCLEYLETIRGEIPLSPIFLTNYLIGRFMFALHELEKAVKTGDASYKKYAQEARLWGKEIFEGKQEVQKRPCGGHETHGNLPLAHGQET